MRFGLITLGAFALAFVLACLHGAIILAGGNALVSLVMLGTIFWFMTGTWVWQDYQRVKREDRDV
ncbi:hypothetical protein EBQ81_00885 [bacterium]|nr:hypothetical protein [bacterium]